jgi:hypothetical protein
MGSSSVGMDLENLEKAFSTILDLAKECSALQDRVEGLEEQIEDAWHEARNRMERND